MKVINKKPKPPRVVLLGAGASAQAGIPTANSMLPAIRSLLIDANASTGVLAAFDAVLGALNQVRALAGDPFGATDVENMYAALVELSNKDESLLAPFVSTWAPHITGVEQRDLKALTNSVRISLESNLNAALDEGVHSDSRKRAIDIRGQLHDFGDDLHNLVSAAVGLRSPSFRDAATAILYTLPKLCWIEDRSKIDYLIPLVRGAATRRTWIATVNFDNTIELAADGAGIPVDLGLSSRSGAINFMPESPMSLAKLHGSLNWPMNDPWRVTVQTEPDPISRTIFGSTNKLRIDGPFLDLLLAFRNALDTADDLEVCGYSFRDAHVNHTILRWLSLKDGRRVHVFDTQLTEDKLRANIDSNIGLLMPTGNKVTIPPQFIATHFTVQTKSAADWATI